MAENILALLDPASNRFASRSYGRKSQNHRPRWPDIPTTGRSKTHAILAKDERIVPAPKHAEIKRGLLIEIITEAGLTREEFIATPVER